MRISDWSSDVCSSDLVCTQSTALRLSSATLPEAPASASTGAVGAPAWDACGGMDWQPASDSAAASRETASIEWRMANLPEPGRSSSLADRKSVVEGKCVADRLDLGGSLIIKKQQALYKARIQPDK